MSRPTLRQWLWLNFQIGFLSFAPSSRAALYRDAIVVRHGWITDNDFQESLTLAQFLPGPNLVNLSVYLGYRLLGFRGVLAGLGCLAVPGALLAVLVTWLVPLHNPHVEEIFRGFSLGSVALMFVFLFKLRGGLVISDSQAQPPSRTKIAARLLILTAVTFAACLHRELHTILLAGVPVCLLVEFSL